MIQSFTISALLDNLSMMAPELTLAASFLIVVFAVIAFRSPANAKVIGAIALAGCSIAFLSAAEQFWLLKGPYFPFGEMLILDRLSGFFNLFFLAGTIVIILASLASRPLSRYAAGEYYAILTGCALAMMILARSLDWLMFYLALETLSLGSYVLSGYTRDNPRAAEASMKYFVYGTVASALRFLASRICMA